MLGIFKFVKDAGETLARAVGLGGADVEDLTKALNDNGLVIANLTLSIEKDVATIGGVARNQAEREKAVLVIGNTKGIETVHSNLTLPPPPVVVATAAPAPAPAPEPESRLHTVAKGDTLWKIAEEMYGNGAKYQTIFEANRPMLKHPDKIYPGQVLRVPPLD
jgi:nucleoid-associated protein YgaU